MILQNARGYKPLSIFLIALCTSDLVEETPRPAYRSDDSSVMSEVYQDSRTMLFELSSLSLVRAGGPGGGGRSSLTFPFVLFRRSTAG